MMYTKEERLDIGRRIYNDEINKNQAAEKFGISPDTARDYMRMYRDTNHLPPKSQRQSTQSAYSMEQVPQPLNLADYEVMSKDELIKELIKSRITEARLKKGYNVKGDGPNKEFIHLGNKNIR